MSERANCTMVLSAPKSTTNTKKESQLSPRDMAGLFELKKLGLMLVEIRISQVSPAKGQLLASIPLPETTSVLCLIKGDTAYMNLESEFLEEGDRLYVLTNDETGIRSLFTI